MIGDDETSGRGGEARRRRRRRDEVPSSAHPRDDQRVTGKEAEKMRARCNNLLEPRHTPNKWARI